MAALNPPFRAQDMEGLYKKVISGVYPDIPRRYSQDLSDLIRTMLQVNPRLRPDCRRILQMPLVARHNNINDPFQQTELGNLLGTIKLPPNTNIRSLTDKLPGPNYNKRLNSASNKSPFEKNELDGGQRGQTRGVVVRNILENPNAGMFNNPLNVKQDDYSDKSKERNYHYKGLNANDYQDQYNPLLYDPDYQKQVNPPQHYQPYQQPQQQDSIHHSRKPSYENIYDPPSQRQAQRQQRDLLYNLPNQHRVQPREPQRSSSNQNRVPAMEPPKIQPYDQPRLPSRDQPRLPSRDQPRLPSRDQPRLPSREQQRLPSRDQQRLPSREQQRVPSREQRRLPSRDQPRANSRDNQRNQLIDPPRVPSSQLQRRPTSKEQPRLNSREQQRRVQDPPRLPSREQQRINSRGESKRQEQPSYEIRAQANAAPRDVQQEQREYIRQQLQARPTSKDQPRLNSRDQQRRIPSREQPRLPSRESRNPVRAQADLPRVPSWEKPSLSPMINYRKAPPAQLSPNYQAYASPKLMSPNYQRPPSYNAIQRHNSHEIRPLNQRVANPAIDVNRIYARGPVATPKRSPMYDGPRIVRIGN